MLSRDTQEASSGEVAIPDVEGPVLRQLLAYLYTLHAPQLPGVAHQLMAAADKYGLSDLKAHCEHQVGTVPATVCTQPEVVQQPANLPAETNLADGAATPGTQPHSGSGQTPASAVVPTASCKCRTRNDPTATRLLTPAAADNGTTATNQPYSDHGQTAASASTPIAANHSHPPDNAPASRLWGPTEEEKGRQLIEAAEMGAVEELSTLLAAGVDVGSRGVDRETALHRAAGKGHMEVARRLLAAGADVDARGSAHSTPLHWAAVNGRTDVVQLLAAASADPDARDQRGWTPLHYAASSGHAEVVTALLQAGADRGAKSNAGDMPIDIARLYNQQQLADILK